MDEKRDAIIDFDRSYVDADGRMLFGQFKGWALRDVAGVNPKYLRWVLESIPDLSDSVRADIEAALTPPAPRARQVGSRRGARGRAPFQENRVGRATASRSRALLPEEVFSELEKADRALFAAVESVQERVEPAQQASESTPSPLYEENEGQKTETQEVDLVSRQPPPDVEALPALPALPALLEFDLPSLDLPLVAPAFAWNALQQEALDAIEPWAAGRAESRLLSLTGFAGTGKSSLIRAAVKMMQGAHLSAMTGMAALRLFRLTNYPTTTLHAVLYKPPEEQRGGDLEFSARKSPQMATLVVDEGSLITPKVYLDLLAWAEEGVKILIVGDPFQLPPIVSKEEAETWGDDFTVFEKIKGPTLTQVMRAGGSILDAATFLRENRRVPTKSSGGYRYQLARDVVERAIQDFLDDPFDHLILTWRNDVRLSMNRAIRQRYGFTGQLPVRGEPVLIKQNTIGRLNGEVVHVREWEEGPAVGNTPTMWLRTQEGDDLLAFVRGHKQFFDGGRPFIEDWAGYQKFCREPESRPRDANGNPVPIPIPVTYGYVLTAHAAQGSEARRVTTVLGPGDNASRHFRKPSKLPSGETVPFSIRWLYTALTRAREQSTLYICNA